MESHNLLRLEKLESSLKQLNDVISSLDHKINLLITKVNESKDKNIWGLSKDELKLADKY